MVKTIKDLSQHQKEVLMLLADGYDSGEIALKLHYTKETIRRHINEIIAYMDAFNATHAVAKAFRKGIIK